MAMNPSPDTPYRAFSGANIYAMIGNRRVGTLQALTVSITREVAALYSFSDANPKAFVKGKRGIAGSLVFTQFDRHALLQDVFVDSFNKKLRDTNGNFHSRFLGAAESNNTLADENLLQSRWFVSGEAAAAQASVLAGYSVGQDIRDQLQSVYDMVANQQNRYSDQIPEFDITVTMVNDAGDAAYCVIGGVQLVNEGWGYTLDDLTSEVAFTYVARGITPLTSLSTGKGSELNGTNLFGAGSR